MIGVFLWPKLNFFFFHFFSLKKKKTNPKQETVKIIEATYGQYYLLLLE